MNRPRDRNRPSSASRVACDRRNVLAAVAGVGVTTLAGCAASDDTLTLDNADDTAATGTFRLLISDQPVAIDDFDRLDVSFDRARIFRAGDVDEAEAVGDDPDPANNSANNESDAGAENDDDESENRPENGEQRGFTVIDLGGATVDLTQVIGEKAIGVFEGELEAAQYAKIELYAADIEGIVDGESVEVMVPSEKLQIVTPFEVVAGESLEFVFDINVVEKGQTGEYNLLPVISESGVAGRDVEVDVIGTAGPHSAPGESAEAGNESTS